MLRKISSYYSIYIVIFNLIIVIVANNIDSIITFIDKFSFIQLILSTIIIESTFGIIVFFIQKKVLEKNIRIWYFNFIKRHFQTSSLRDVPAAIIRRPRARQAIMTIAAIFGWGYVRFNVQPRFLTDAFGTAMYSFPVEVSVLVMGVAWWFTWPEYALMRMVGMSLICGELIPHSYAVEIREMPASFGYFLLVWMVACYLLGHAVNGVVRRVRTLFDGQISYPGADRMNNDGRGGGAHAA